MKCRELDGIEQRVTGALLEKAQTTPEYYPLTLKALVAACNQRSNRDPVTDYSEDEVRDALERLRADVLAWRVDGARVSRWKTTINRRLDLEESQIPLLTLLLLRGPQTSGELRGRASRMWEYGSVDEVEEQLREMSEGIDAVVVELERQLGQKGQRWMHRLGGDIEIGRSSTDEERSSLPRPTPLLERVAHLEELVERLRKDLDDLLQQLTD